MKLGKMKWNYCYLLVLGALVVSCSDASTSDVEELFDQENTDVELVLVQLSAEEQELFDLINDHRESQNLEAVTYSGDTYIFAQEHNEYMISKGILSHDNFNARASQISEQTAANFVAENVAKNFEQSVDALEAWLDSEEHKSTIEGDFTHSTLSISYDEQGNPYYTQIFFRK